MARALKTQATKASVANFLDRIENTQVRDDCRALVRVMEKAIGAKPRMWGPSIVGFGSCRYRYPDGHEMDWMLAAFSPRKQAITVYFLPGFKEYDELMARLGKHACGKSCLYIKRLSDVHLPTLTKLIKASAQHMRRTHGTSGGRLKSGG